MLAPPRLGDHAYQDSTRLADWVEIILLTEEESEVSVTGVIGELAAIPPDESRDSERRFEYADLEVAYDGQMRSGFREEAENKAEAAFRELSMRASWLGDRYPVRIEDDVALLRQDAAARNVYQFLVLLRARHFYQDSLGDDGIESGLLFEDLVKHAFGAYVGAKSDHQVRFGVAGGSRGDGLPLPLSEAVNELSHRMFEKAGQVFENDRDDFRVDAVAWKPFYDKRPGQMVLIGQATISEGDWVGKEPANRWTDRQPPGERLIRFVARPFTAVAFPETLSLTSPATLDGMLFSSIPFDRLRLLSVLRDEDLPSDLLKRMKCWVDGVRSRLPS